MINSGQYLNNFYGKLFTCGETKARKLNQAQGYFNPERKSRPQ